jgi:hypothetical protein
MEDVLGLQGLDTAAPACGEEGHDDGDIWVWLTVTL